MHHAMQLVSLDLERSQVQYVAVINVCICMAYNLHNYSCIIRVFSQLSRHLSFIYLLEPRIHVPKHALAH
jgi:hypothetical protein